MPRTHRPRVFPPLLGCVLLLAAAVAAAREPGRFTLDPVHTRLVLAIDHAGFSKAIGTVSGATGTVWTLDDDWTGARVEVSIPLDRLDFGDAEWNRAVAARGLLDTARHPVARFVSTRVEPVDAGHAVVHGTLSLRGVDRAVSLDVVRNGARRHPLPPFRSTVGFSATTVLSRADFGITSWKSVIGDRIELRIELEAVRARGSGTDAAPADTMPGPVDDTAPDAAALEAAADAAMDDTPPAPPEDATP